MLDANFPGENIFWRNTLCSDRLENGTSFSSKKIVWRTSVLLCRTTLFWTSSLGFKARVDPWLACFVTSVQWIHQWCNTHKPWVSKPGWIPGLHTLSPVFGGFTSGTTPTDPLVSSMAAEPFDPHTCTSVQAMVGLEPGIACTARCTMC